MSMPGNPYQHFEEATGLLANNQGGQYEIERGRALALLALAHEQRTANLIAAFGQMMDGIGDTYLGQLIDGYALAKEIIARLGLKDNA